MTTAAFVALLIMFAAGVLLAARAVLGPGLADRALAVDGLVSVLAGSLAITAVWSGETRYIDDLVIVALVGFVGTVTVSRYIEERGR